MYKKSLLLLHIQFSNRDMDIGNSVCLTLRENNLDNLALVHTKMFTSNRTAIKFFKFIIQMQAIQTQII